MLFRSRPSTPIQEYNLVDPLEPLVSRGQLPPASPLASSSYDVPEPRESETTPPKSSHRRSRSARPHTPTRPPATIGSPFDDLPLSVRLPPRPSDIPDQVPSLAGSRETSPSRFASLASPLARIATVKHARTQSSPMGFTADSKSSRSGSPNRPGSSAGGNAATMFANMFRNPESTPDKKGLFGFAFPTSPSPSLRTRNGGPPPTDAIDEFAGINFQTLLKEYLEEPTGLPESPADALVRTPEERLGAAVETAVELIERVYAAYRQRTASLAETLGENDLQKEYLANERVNNEALKHKLGRLEEEERVVREEQTVRLQEQQTRIRELELELLRERRKRDAIEEEVRVARQTSRSKRTSAASAASDSGFESDVESIYSRSAVVSPVEDGEGAAAGHEEDACKRCIARQRESIMHTAAAAAVGAETRNPTPLREAWGPGEGGGVWGFFKGRQQQQQQQGWQGGNNIDSIKMENRWLRARIGELETAVEGALEAVAGRGV